MHALWTIDFFNGDLQQLKYEKLPSKANHSKSVDCIKDKFLSSKQFQFLGDRISWSKSKSGVLITTLSFNPLCLSNNQKQAWILLISYIFSAPEICYFYL